SVVGQKPDEANLAFMLSMMKSIGPRDSVEAMLVAQMVSIHVTAMRCAYRLAHADDIARQDSAARALGRLVRTFPAQVEALSRYRNNGAPAVTVQNLSVGDGGRAIVATSRSMRAWSLRTRKPGHERSCPRYGSDAGEPALRRQDP